MKRELCYFSLGSNMGDSRWYLHEAIRLLEKEIGSEAEISPIYRTKAWGKTDQPDFLNVVIRMPAATEPERVMEKVLEIEHRLGRVREERWGPRVIDIDILFYGDRIIDVHGLKIPHPELQKRKFVLVPLNDLAPEFIHPVIGKTIAQLVAECEDQAGIFAHEV